MTDFNSFLASAANKMPTATQALHKLIDPGSRFDRAEVTYLKGETFSAYAIVRDSLIPDYNQTVIQVFFNSLPSMPGCGFRPLLAVLTEICKGEPNPDWDVYPATIKITDVISFYSYTDCRLLITREHYDSWNNDGANRNDEIPEKRLEWFPDTLFGIKFAFPSAFVTKCSLLGPAEELAPLLSKFIVD